MLARREKKCSSFVWLKLVVVMRGDGRNDVFMIRTICFSFALFCFCGIDSSECCTECLTLTLGMEQGNESGQDTEAPELIIVKVEVLGITVNDEPSGNELLNFFHREILNDLPAVERSLRAVLRSEERCAYDENVRNFERLCKLIGVQHPNEASILHFILSISNLTRLLLSYIGPRAMMRLKLSRSLREAVFNCWEIIRIPLLKQGFRESIWNRFPMCRKPQFWSSSPQFEGPVLSVLQKFLQLQDRSDIDRLGNNLTLDLDLLRRVGDDVHRALVLHIEEVHSSWMRLEERYKYCKTLAVLCRDKLGVVFLPKVLFSVWSRDSIIGCPCAVFDFELWTAAKDELFHNQVQLEEKIFLRIPRHIEEFHEFHFRIQREFLGQRVTKGKTVWFTAFWIELK
jgi:hypothetical protein